MAPVVQGNAICRDRVFAVERALMLLQCFEYVQETRTLASLAKQSGLYKSTILRLTNSMCKMGFLLRQPDGLFSVGPELARFGMPKQEPIDLEELIRSGLRTLADTRYSAFFCVRQDRRPACLFREDGSEDLLAVGKRGARRALTSGAALHVLRAYSRHAKDEELMLVRERGWALSTSGGQLDLTTLAVPILNREKVLLGALAVAGRSGHFAEERQRILRQTMSTVAQDLSAEMRFLHPIDLVKSVARCA